MENKVQIFDNPEFGEIRVVMKDGEPHFVAADVCRILEIRNVSDALSRLDDDEKSIAFIPAMGIGLTDTHGGQEMLIVNEPGLYRLIFASRKKEAKEFQRWVYHEVLPSIRKTGSYSVAPANNGIDSLAQAISKLADVEREKLAFERDKFAVENGEDAKIFEAVQTLRELASASGDEKYMRSKLVWLAANLLVDKNFIEGHEIIFKKCQ
ncbi:MAG: Bro-N domain-containing protein [Selenomonadaceae bacterium]|nr:Bro-N domain-containing protein [Selenomonadaceae bacterium]